ncbi:hypothetical protein QQ045_012830 [Rhodiola kirilowii]
MLEADDNHHHDEEIEQGKEVEHKESLMDKISEKVHDHDSSSDSGEDDNHLPIEHKESLMNKISQQADEVMLVPLLDDNPQPLEGVRGLVY